MAAIDFPDTPSINDIHTVGTRSWVWTGQVWQTITTQQGTQGDKGGLRYTFEAITTMAEPDPGKVRFNNSDESLTTKIAINQTTSEGADLSNYFISLAESLPSELSIIKYYIIISNNINNDPGYAIYGVTNVTDNTSWIELDVQYVAGTAIEDNDDLVISLSRVGDLGPTGPETSISLGTVDTGAPGGTADVSITGPAGDQVLSFTIPQGPTGPGNTLTVGTVNTGDPGSTAIVSITGSSPNQTIDFTVPQGPTGPETSISIGTTSTGDPGTSALASITGPAGNQILDFTIPQGPTGPYGVYKVSDTEPTPVENGLGWFNAETGRYYIYYDGYWIENSSSLVGPQGLGYDGIQSTTIVTVPSSPTTITFTLNKIGALTIGSRVRLSNSGITKWMEGAVSSINQSNYNIDVDVDAWLGAGELDDLWYLSISGTQGSNGVGIPTGGTDGQILKKLSETDYDLGWSVLNISELETVDSDRIISAPNYEIDISSSSNPGTYNLDFTNGNGLHSIETDTNITFTSSNYKPGSIQTVRIYSYDDFTISFPAEWVFVGNKPTTLTPNKTSILTVTSFGTTQADCVAAFIEEL